MKREDLRAKLLELRENEFKIEEREVNDILDAMMMHIGDEDPELRDKLIFTSFIELVELKKVASKEKIVEILEKLIGEDFMFFKIGNNGDNSALRRSFSVLAVNPILCRHLDQPFLSEDIINRTRAAVIRFLKEEEDIRGYHKKYGWIHSIAHCSDALDMAINCEGTTTEMVEEILDVIGDRLCDVEEYFVSDEYERLVTPIYYDIMEDKLVTDQYICTWIDGLCERTLKKEGIEKIISRTNVKNFIRSLYFRIELAGGSEEIKKALLEGEKKLNIYVE